MEVLKYKPADLDLGSLLGPFNPAPEQEDTPVDRDRTEENPERKDQRSED